MASWVDAFFWVMALLHLAIAMKLLFHLRAVERLPRAEEKTVDAVGHTSRSVPKACADSGDGFEPRSVPFVSVIVPARNEEERIGKSVERLSKQEGVRLEVIVVNDRSTDRTGEILGEARKRLGSFELLEVTELPPRWLGKCYACHLGAQRAKGEWLLFSDADVWLAPDVIRRAVLVAEAEKVDHICLSPGVEAETIWGEAWHVFFLLALAKLVDRANHDRPNRGVGIGAFNLVRRSAYDAIGGYERLRLTVVDDMKLGLLLARAGRKSRCYLGEKEVACHWATTVTGMVRVMEKNFFAAVDYNVAIIPFAALFLGVVWLSGVAGPLTGRWSGIAAGLAFCAQIIPAIILARRTGKSIGSAFLVPLTWPWFAAAMVNSAIVTLSRGGVSWRDTFYPLDLLRQENVK